MFGCIRRKVGSGSGTTGRRAGVREAGCREESIGERRRQTNRNTQMLHFIAIKQGAPSCRTPAKHESGFCPTVIQGMSSGVVATGACSDIPGRPPVRGWHHGFSEGAIPRPSHAPTDEHFAAGTHFLKLIRCRTPPPPRISQHQLQFWLKDDPQKTRLTRRCPSRGAGLCVCVSVIAIK